MSLLTNDHKILLKRVIWNHQDLNQSKPMQDILNYLCLDDCSSEGYLARVQMHKLRACKYCWALCDGQSCTYCWESSKGMDFMSNQFFWKFTPAGRELLAHVRAAADKELNATDLGIYQRTVARWCEDMFGETCAKDPQERGLRLLEEAIEAAQSVQISKDQAHLLVEYVYNRPTGDLPQEISGVFVTMLALAASQGLDAETCLAKELQRITAPGFREKIRAKHNTKQEAGVSNHRS